jgi:DNA-binding transcriptional MerR regulator
MQLKTTRAFRTISEAGEELDLQPHVLRFWESKFPQIKPMKRGGGRRFYRPEDIEFLRGIKILLHDEKHPIKDVQKLIRVKGAGRVMELGRSIERAAKPKPVEEVELIPERIANYEPEPETVVKVVETSSPDTDVLRPISEPESTRKSFGKGVKVAPVIHSVDLEEDEVVVPPPATEPVDIDLPEVDYVDDDIEEYIETEVDLNDIQDGDVILDETPTTPVTPSAPIVDKESLEDALAKLTALRNRWVDFKSAKASSD